jgi:hypothetical protein
MSSFKTVLVVLIAFISIGELVKIVLVNGVGVDRDIGGVEGGEGVGGATRRIILEGLNGIKSVPANALSIFVISMRNEPSKGPAQSFEE